MPMATKTTAIKETTPMPIYQQIKAHLRGILSPPAQQITQEDTLSIDPSIAVITSQ